MEKKFVYAIIENCIVCSNDDGDGLENDTEPVVCISVGVFMDYKKAEKECKRLNREYEEKDHFEVKAIEVRG